MPLTTAANDWPLAYALRLAPGVNSLVATLPLALVATALAARDLHAWFRARARTRALTSPRPWHSRHASHSSSTAAAAAAARNGTRATDDNDNDTEPLLGRSVAPNAILDDSASSSSDSGADSDAAWRGSEGASGTAASSALDHASWVLDAPAPPLLTAALTGISVATAVVYVLASVLLIYQHARAAVPGSGGPVLLLDCNSSRRINDLNESDDDSLATYPLLLASHLLGAVAWTLLALLLASRRYHWDSTWTLAAPWALAAFLSLVSAYNHVQYLTMPTPLDQPYLDALNRSLALMSAVVLPAVGSAVLSAAALARFRIRSAASAELSMSLDEESAPTRSRAGRRRYRLHRPSHNPDAGTTGPWVGSTAIPNGGGGCEGSRTARSRSSEAIRAHRTDPRSAAAVAAAVAATTTTTTDANPTAATPLTAPPATASAAEAVAAATAATGVMPKIKPPSSMAEYADKFRKLFPFVWPRSDRYLQFLVLLCGFLLVIGRVVNVLLPIQTRTLVDELTFQYARDPNLPPHMPWEPIAIYVLLRFLQGGVGLVSTTQDLLWMPIGQYTTRAISLRMFAHLHDLSHRFHLNRKTGEILRVQERGVASIVNLLSTVLFNIVPTLVDIAIAVIVFAIQFDWEFAAIVFVTMVLYIVATVAITEVRTKHRKRSNALENAMEARAVDSLLNFETVKYYNAEAFEVSQYAKAMREYQDADWLSSLTTSWLSMSQNLIIQLGLLAGAMLCAYRVAVRRSMTVGEFILFISYITQLYGPLNSFGSYYRQLQKNFVDMESLLHLLAVVPEIRDAPDPVYIKPSRMEGHICFENVEFAYDPRTPTLKNVSFEVPAGKTVALVGPSGSGKSSCMRLLFRFYDVVNGRVTIDGIDIRAMAQLDLRGLIGVVPQDTVLFNDTIRYNIRYGRVGATDDEVVAAAQAAQIHDRIMSFPEGYDTRVGERGLRLSGGEVQRVAVARTLLKNPVITFWDEATSALDTTTERLLQNQLRLVTENRTTLMIAHRLSTVIHADQIIVLKDGVIVERGSHEELLARDQGVYREMWSKQLEDNDAFLNRQAAASSAAPKTPLVVDPTIKSITTADVMMPSPGPSGIGGAAMTVHDQELLRLQARITSSSPLSSSSSNSQDGHH
ncbi:hypothetical protein BC828DRAFT_388877 [Blastocladiella britannica]|nr:hypothetical protein BC828DRAFT_388877 [Blastocladiella britannica]